MHVNGQNNLELIFILIHAYGRFHLGEVAMVSRTVHWVVLPPRPAALCNMDVDFTVSLMFQIIGSILAFHAAIPCSELHHVRLKQDVVAL